MKIAVIALTKNGVKISEKICKNLTCDRFVLDKFAEEGAAPFSSLSGLVKEIFDKYEGLVFICALGIAVRSVAPRLRSKLTDPAVVVMDEGGKFAIPTLSGHVGGANLLARRLAEITGARPIITTATDVGGKFSPDSFAIANGLFILEPELVKAVAAAVVNGEDVGFYSDYPCRGKAEGLTGEGRIGVCVSADSAKMPFDSTLHLIPRNVIIGLGCRKNTAPAKLETFVLNSLEMTGLPICRLAGAVTIDRKREEGAILQFCKKYSLPLEFCSARELAAVEGEFSHSDFVLAAVGVDNVCERCAVHGGGRLILPKQAGDGVTVAAAEREIVLDFRRRT